MDCQSISGFKSIRAIVESKCGKQKTILTKLWTELNCRPKIDSLWCLSQENCILYDWGSHYRNENSGDSYVVMYIKHRFPRVMWTTVLPTLKCLYIGKACIWATK